MKAYSYRWPDNQVSIILAESPAAALIGLDEIGEPRPELLSELEMDKDAVLLVTFEEVDLDDGEEGMAWIASESGASEDLIDLLDGLVSGEVTGEEAPAKETLS
jgi:hypothetical protein